MYTIKLFHGLGDHLGNTWFTDDCEHALEIGWLAILELVEHSEDFSFRNINDSWIFMTTSCDPIHTHHTTVKNTPAFKNTIRKV